MKINRKMIRNAIPRLRESIQFHGPRFYRRCSLSMHRNQEPDGLLVAGPYVGELGFEIGEWIPYIKGLMELYHCRAHVFTRKGHEILYPFAEKIHTIDFPSEHTMGIWLFRPSPEEINLYNQLEQNSLEYFNNSAAKYRFRMFEKCDRKDLFKEHPHRSPVILEAPKPLKEKWRKKLPSTPKVILSCRALARGSERNSNIDVLNKTANYIIENGWTPVLIGKFDSQYPVPEIPGVNLINQTSLDDLIAIYKLSSLIIGSSTGVIHLAASCGTPHITWGSTKEDETVIVRYNKAWNLNNTWVRFISKEWDVDFSEIKAALEKRNSPLK